MASGPAAVSGAAGLLAPERGMMVEELGGDAEQYRLWHARKSFNNLRTFFVVTAVIRCLQVAVLFNYRAWPCVLAAAGFGIRAIVPFLAAPFKSEGDSKGLALSQKEVRYWWAVQIWLVISTPSVAFFTHITDCNHSEVFLLNFVPVCVLQAAFLNLPHWVYYAGAIPVNILSFAVHEYLNDNITPLACLRLSFAIVVSIFVYKQRDITTGALYRESTAIQRAQKAVEEREAETEVWRSAFRGLLDSVFDASCVCDAAGHVHSSTPQLDQLLIGCSKAGLDLQGTSLADFAADDAERVRLTAFLTDVAGSRVARKIQLSLLARPQGLGEQRRRLELAISGIGLPLAGAGGAQAAFKGVSVFLGVELVLGDVLEQDASAAEEKGEEDALDLSTRVAAALPADADLVSEADLHSVGAADVAAGRRGSAPSVWSAPAMLVGGVAAAGGGAGSLCAGGDCLPPDATVWVQGRTAPTRVGDVEPTDKVLCFDHLASGMKYAEVADARAHDASESQWVEVVLCDGSTLRMTADHPVFPMVAADEGGAVAGSGFAASSAAVKAEDLQASRHGLQVLRLMPVAVEEVRSLNKGSLDKDGQELPKERISLSVAQPVRHSIFVASSGQGAGGVAVASANVDVRHEELNGGYRIKNTFVTLTDEDEDGTSAAPSLVGGPRRRRRRHSAPPRARPAASENSGGGGGGGGAGCRPEVRLAAGSILGSGGSSVGGSWLSSAASLCSEALGPACIVVSSGPAANRNQPKLTAEDALNNPVARISDALLARQLGLRSVGSLGHEHGWCMPCLMETWHQNEGPEKSGPCKNGLFCYRCHECHNDHTMKEIRRVRRQQERRTNRHRQF